MNVLAVVSIVLSGIALIFLSLRLWLYSKYIDYLNNDTLCNRVKVASLACWVLAIMSMLASVGCAIASYFLI